MIDKIELFFRDHTANIALILIVSSLLRRFALKIVQNVIRRGITSNGFKTKHDEKQREDTLISIVNALLKITIWLMAGLLILSELGIYIAPLLAGASVAGVALGFGAQSMVKDFLSGMFILVENQYRVGDVIKLNQTVSGTVETLTLRHTVLRDLDGMVHSIPNGEIRIATNMTMEYANVNLDIGVGYDTDIDKLEKLINKVSSELSKDPDWEDRILQPPVFKRITDFSDSAIVVKIVGRTQPMMQWAVTGELRRRLKSAFDKAGIEIPFPQRVIHNATKGKKN